MVDARVDDAQLVEAARTGNRAAFGAIFDRYSPRILAFCTRLLNEPHTAADATQDTFIAAAGKLDQLRDPTALRPWLYAIARNECTRHGRARAKAVPTDDQVMAGSTSDDLAADVPAAAAAAGEAGGILWDAAAGLDEPDQILLELHVRHGLEGAELAEAAGVSPGQISMVTGRMRERVARSVGALLIARKGRSDCPGLQVVLADWDGAFSVLIRKRVARHIDNCDLCEERRTALVAPFGSLAVGPILVAFTVRDGALDGVRERVLEAFDGGGSGGAAGDAGRSDEGGGRRRALTLVALVVAALLLLGLPLALALRSDGSDQAVKTAGVGASTTTADELATSTTGASSSTSAPSGATTTSKPSVSPNQAGTTTSIDGTSGGTAPATTLPVAGPSGTSPGVTAVPAPVPTTAPPPPNQAPSVGATSRSGTSAMQTSCNPANSTRTITVTVTDDAGPATVLLRWNQAGVGTGQKAMTRSGSTYTAMLGPFAQPGSVTYRAVATDGDGASASSSTASVTVDPCPG